MNELEAEKAMDKVYEHLENAINMDKMIEGIESGDKKLIHILNKLAKK